MKRLTTLAVIVAMQTAPAAAQEKDTTTAPAGGGGLGICVAIAVATAGMLFVPALFLLVPPDSSVADVKPVLRSGTLLYGGAGITGLMRPGPSGVDWAASAGAQIRYRHLLADVRIDDQGVHQAYQLQSAQLAYLFAPEHRRAAAGLSLGVQRVEHDPGRDAVTVGLPLVMSSATYWTRLEPRYVFSPKATEWHWRGDLMAPVTRGSPLIVGLSCEFKPIPERGPYHGIISLIVGLQP